MPAPLPEITEPAFTKGPWFIHSSGRLASETELSRFEIGHGTNSYRDGPEGIVARLEGVSEADARLMKTAPDLYEALADFERSAALIANTASEIAPEQIAREGARAWVRCLNNARAALSKARGEQS